VSSLIFDQRFNEYKEDFTKLIHLCFQKDLLIPISGSKLSFDIWVSKVVGQTQRLETQTFQELNDIFFKSKKDYLKTKMKSFGISDANMPYVWFMIDKYLIIDSQERLRLFLLKFLSKEKEYFDINGKPQKLSHRSTLKQIVTFLNFYSISVNAFSDIDFELRDKIAHSLVDFQRKKVVLLDEVSFEIVKKKPLSYLMQQTQISLLAINAFANAFTTETKQFNLLFFLNLVESDFNYDLFDMSGLGNTSFANSL
jgi:hypothetical protein